MTGGRRPKNCFVGEEQKGLLLGQNYGYSDVKVVCDLLGPCCVKRLTRTKSPAAQLRQQRPVVRHHERHGPGKTAPSAVGAPLASAQQY